MTALIRLRSLLLDAVQLLCDLLIPDEPGAHHGESIAEDEARLRRDYDAERDWFT